MLVPVWLGGDRRARRFRCPDCDLLVALDQERCDHCGRVISEGDREAMQANHRTDRRQGLAHLALLMGFVAVVALIVLSLAG